MKNILKTFGLLLLSGTAFVACDDYLDRQPDEQLTPDQIFLKASTTEQYLTNVYAYQPNYSDPSGQTLPWAPCADESSIAYTGRSYTQINYDTWDPSINLQRSYTYNNIYKGIREASYFMQHVYECPEIGDTDKGYMYNEARFLRAYYYSLLMSTFGPVFILGDEPTDYEQEDLNERERDSWEKCVDYVTTELYEASKGLPQEWASAKYGRATKGAALAIRSRVYLYSARKLFNGNDLYKGVIDKYGNPLFPTVYDEKKWETAAQAAKDVIDMNIYGLVGADGTDPYGSLHDLYTTVGPVNSVTEMIFSRIVSAYNWGIAATPRMARSRAYGSFGPTQKLVDAFAMANGRYPITGYTNGDQTQPIIDPESGYSETGFSTFTHPIFGDQLANTFMMYQNREPRFYINVLWSGCVWHSGNVNKGVVQLYTGGNSGYAATQQNNPFDRRRLDQYGRVGLHRLADHPLRRDSAQLRRSAQRIRSRQSGHPHLSQHGAQARGRPRHRESLPRSGGQPEADARTDPPRTHGRTLLRESPLFRHPHMDDRRNGARRRLRHEHRRDEPQRQQRFLETHAQHPRQRIERQRTSQILAARLPLPHFAGGDGPYELHAELRLVTLIQFRQS